MEQPHHRRAFAVGAIYCAVAVLLGAFGAHGLKALWPPERLAIFETGVRYLMYAGLGLQLAAVARGQRPLLILLGVGALIFSGSLFLMCVTHLRLFGAITPIGGLSMMLAWGFLRARD